jgi:hypothetical protein
MKLKAIGEVPIGISKFRVPLTYEHAFRNFTGSNFTKQRAPKELFLPIVLHNLSPTSAKMELLAMPFSRYNALYLYRKIIAFIKRLK